VTTLALGIVLLSAVLHATWNLYAKRAGGGATFVWIFNCIASAAYLPFAIATIMLQQPVIGWPQILFMAGSAVLELGYFFALLRGYRLGDLSLVYPLARGTGPLISTFGAILLFAERPSALALGGMLLIACGAFMLTVAPSVTVQEGGLGAVGYGLVTGLLIGAYTLWDKYAVSTLLTPPLLQYYGSAVGQALLLTPYVLRHRAEIGQEWRERRRALLVVGLVSPISYILVLTALAMSPVSYVAPAREVSILLAAILGSRLLAEGESRRRIIASGAMVVGVMAIALG
jgi:drug/metabolite transporter (DMT)-like permease